MRCTLAVRSCLSSIVVLAIALGIAACHRTGAAEESEPAAFVRAAEVPLRAADAASEAEAGAPEPAPAEPPAIEASAGEALGGDAALDLATVELDAGAALERGAPSAAAAGYSRLLLAAFRGAAPEDRATLARWSGRLASAQAKHRWSATGSWPSLEQTVLAGDGLIAVRKRVIAAHPELKLSTGLIARANGLASDATLQPGMRLRIPTDRASVIVDVSARWLAYLHGTEVVAAWEVGVGRPGSETPCGSYAVGLKQRNPMWFPEGRSAVAFGDPANPLGTRWIGWLQGGRETRLGFHGTNAPDQTGSAVSEGCVRLRNEDVELLFEVLPEGAPVLVQP